MATTGDVSVTVFVEAPLTDDEHEAIELLGRVANLLSQSIVTDGPTRDEDLHELFAHVHAIQRAVASQAAVRAYPHRYRLLGGAGRDTALLGAVTPPAEPAPTTPPARHLHMLGGVPVSGCPGCTGGYGKDPL